MATGVIGFALLLALGAGEDSKQVPPAHKGSSVQAAAPRPSTTAVTPPTPTPPPHPHHRHRGPAFSGTWAPVRVSQGIDEIQTRGPGQITPVTHPDPIDAALVGNWKLVLPVLTVADDGYARIDTVRETQELGQLTIGAGGSFDWRIPGRVRSGGNLVEVTASDASAGDHFWSFSGNGQTLVIAPGENGTLILFDASSNAFYARAERM